MSWFLSVLLKDIRSDAARERAEKRLAGPFHPARQVLLQIGDVLLIWDAVGFWVISAVVVRDAKDLRFHVQHVPETWIPPDVSGTEGIVPFAKRKSTKATAFDETHVIPMDRIITDFTAMSRWPRIETVVEKAEAIAAGKQAAARKADSERKKKSRVTKAAGSSRKRAIDADDGGEDDSGFKSESEQPVPKRKSKTQRPDGTKSAESTSTGFDEEDADPQQPSHSRDAGKLGARTPPPASEQDDPMSLEEAESYTQELFKKSATAQGAMEVYNSRRKSGSRSRQSADTTGATSGSIGFSLNPQFFSQIFAPVSSAFLTITTQQQQMQKESADQNRALVRDVEESHRSTVSSALDRFCSVVDGVQKTLLQIEEARTKEIAAHQAELARRDDHNLRVLDVLSKTMGKP